MQPQTCTKCGCLPEDILMLACSHDLCLSCAADRLAFELKKKKPATSIVCEFCYQRTPLDAESVQQLQKIIASKANTRSLNDVGKKGNPIQRQKVPVQRQKVSDRYNYQKSSKYQKANYSSYGNSEKPFTGISSKKQCPQHPEQEILYFCFDCKVECFCPQCVIHGRHKDCNVKTIRKSQPIIKSQVEGNLQKLQNNIENLLIRKSETEKNLRSLTQQNNVSKRQIQQAFQNLRNSLAKQEKQILGKYDQALEESSEQLQRTSMNIVKRIQQLKFTTSTIQQSIKKDDILFLNYYANKWKFISQEIKNNDVEIPAKTLPSNQSTLSSILDANDYIIRIGCSKQVAVNHDYHKA